LKRRREQFINNYIAECTKRGLETPREGAEYAFAFHESEMARLEHLPLPERRRQSAINFGIQWYRKKNGASDEEVREVLIQYLEYLDREQLKIENQQN
jgi:hypothetical protein